jgi:hypothetical protein
MQQADVRLLHLQGKQLSEAPMSALQVAAAAAAGNGSGAVQVAQVQLPAQLYAIQAVSIVPATQSECCRKACDISN